MKKQVKEVKEYVDVTRDCEDKDNLIAIQAHIAKQVKLRYCHECEVYHAV